MEIQLNKDNYKDLLKVGVRGKSGRGTFFEIIKQPEYKGSDNIIYINKCCIEYTDGTFTKVNSQSSYDP